VLIKKLGEFQIEDIDELKSLDKHYWNKPSDFKDLIQGEPDMKYLPSQIEIKSKSYHCRTLLINVLRRQYASFDPDWVDSILQPLASERCFAITCAHQANLLGGPLYWWYKIAHTIALAREATRLFPDYQFVPIYYCGSEDHDFEEVSSVNLFGKRISWRSSEEGSVGRMSVEGLQAAISEVKSLFMNDPEGILRVDEIDKLLTNSADYISFYRNLVHYFFRETPLIFFNPDDEQAKSAFTEYVNRELQDQMIFHQSQESVALLNSMGYQPQAHIRVLNQFYCKEHYRNGIYSDGHQFHTKDQKYQWSPEEIKEEIYTHPARFSPNVVMRPLYQELLLPTVVFVGGGAEMAYWLQLKSVFDAQGSPYPILWRRFSAIIFSSGILDKMLKLGVQWDKAFLKIHLLQQYYLEGHSSILQRVQDTQVQLKKFLKEHHDQAGKFSPTFQQSLSADLTRLEQQIDKISQRILKEEKLQHESDLTKILKIKESLFPDGGLQERSESGIQYFLRYGHEFVENLISIANHETRFIALQILR